MGLLLRLLVLLLLLLFGVICNLVRIVIIAFYCTKVGVMGHGSTTCTTTYFSRGMSTAPPLSLDFHELIDHGKLVIDGKRHILRRGGRKGRCRSIHRGGVVGGGDSMSAFQGLVLQRGFHSGSFAFWDSSRLTLAELPPKRV